MGETTVTTSNTKHLRITETYNTHSFSSLANLFTYNADTRLTLSRTGFTKE